jgi:hypothetical protein
MILEPGAGSPLVEGLFYFVVTLLCAGLALLLARFAFLMSLLWIMPLARMFSFVPAVRRWMERKTSEPAALDDRGDSA